MATFEEYSSLSESAQLLVEMSMFLQERTSIMELTKLGQYSEDEQVIKLTSSIDNSDLNECARSRFFVFRYAAIEPLDFNKEPVFFHALKKPYYRSLCTAFYKYLKDKRSSYSWVWTEHFQQMSNLMKLYVFDDPYIEKNETLRPFFERVKLDDRWMVSDKMLSKLFLKGLEMEKFKRIPFPKLRMQMLEDAFNYSFYQMKVPQAYCEYLLDRLHQIKSLLTVQRLAHTLLFHNNKTGLYMMLKSAPNAFYSSLADAHLYFMNGNFEEAKNAFENNLEYLKKIDNQKRSAFSTSYLMLGFCLLHLKADHNTWDEYWKNLYKEAKTTNFSSILLAILSGHAGIDIVNEWNRTSDDYIVKNSSLFSLVFMSYAAFWSGRVSLSRAFLNFNPMSEIRKNNPWVDQELNSLNLLLNNEDFNLTENTVLWQIYAPKPEWEVLLSQLEKILDDTGAGINTDNRETRIVWRVDLEELILEPVLQKQNLKNNSWSKGRIVSWSKINDLEIIKSSTSQDKEIIRNYSKILNSNNYRYHDKKDPDLISDLLDSMVAHPFLFLDNEHDTPFQIYRGKFELNLIKSDKGYHFENNLKDWTNSNTFVFKRETATRYSFIKISKEQQQLLQLIDKKKIILPNKAEEQLKKTIKKMLSIVPVYSDIVVDDANIPEHPLDDRIYVHILPIADFFQVELFVKPFGDFPPYFPPGIGHQRILSERDGQTIFVNRNLEKEKADAEQLIANSVILNFEEQDNGIWTLDSIESCLKLLSELNDLRKEDKIVLEWPQGEKLKISGYVNFDNFSMNVRSSGNWFELEGELKISDNQILDMRMLLEKSKNSKNRFITLDDGTYIALTDTLFKRLKEIESWTNQQKDKVLISQFAAGILNEMSNDFYLKGDKTWEDFLKKMDEVQEKNYQVPETLKASLRPYQLEGYQWLSRMADWGAGACLADDMGLGKTVQAIALLLQRAELGPALVVAPASVCSNWMSELEKFAPSLKITNLSLVLDRNKTVEELGDTEILVTTYGLLHQASDALCSKKFATIVLDEAQSIKNRFTKRSQAAMDLQADFKLITTGTPLENHLGELWNLFQFINPGLLGTAQQFQDRFSLYIEKYGDIDRREHLQKLIRPFILRRLKRDVLKDLPEKTEITLSIERSIDEEAFYEALRRKALENIDTTNFKNEGQKQFQVLAELMKLRRACCHPSLIEGGQNIPSAKLEALSDLMEELIENKHKALIFSQFVDYLKIIEKLVKDKNISYQYLDGSTPLKKRKVAVDAFQKGDGDLFLISLKAGGTGLNLTAADYVIHVDPWWNPAVEDQASDRAHRIGQQNPVTVYRLVAASSIEEKIVKLHEHKREMAEALLQNTDGKVSMNSKDLLELLRNQ